MTVPSISKPLLILGCLLLITVGFPSQATDYGEFGGGADGGSWDGTTATDSTTSNDNDYSYGSDDYGEFGQGASGGQWNGSKEDSVDYSGGNNSNSGGGSDNTWGGQSEDNSSGDYNNGGVVSPVQPISPIEPYYPVPSPIQPYGTNTFDDIWSGVSKTAGEFGNKLGDYKAHEEAIQKAIKDANEVVDAACSGGCSGYKDVVRAETLNQSYYSALNNEKSKYSNHSLPKGPKETIDRYWGTTGEGIPSHEAYEPFREMSKAFDKAVLDGKIGVVMPGQIGSAFPDDYFTPDELEALRKSPYYIDRTPIDPETGFTMLESLRRTAHKEHRELLGVVDGVLPGKIKGTAFPNRTLGGPNGGAVIVVARGGLTKSVIQEEGQHLIQQELKNAFGITADQKTYERTGLKVETTRSKDEVDKMLADPLVQDGIYAIVKSAAIKGLKIDLGTCPTCGETAAVAPYVGKYTEAAAKRRVFDGEKEKFIDHVDDYIAPAVGADRARVLAEDLYESESLKRDVKGTDALLRVYSDLNL